MNGFIRYQYKFSSVIYFILVFPHISFKSLFIFWFDFICLINVNAYHLNDTKFKFKVNCSFYFKIGACRHGDKCSRTHIMPSFSQTVLLKNLYHNPMIDTRQADAFAKVIYFTYNFFLIIILFFHSFLIKGSFFNEISWHNLSLFGI